MKHKILISALIAIGFSLHGVSHAVPQTMTKPDGTKVEANVEGNKLLLRDATGKRWLPASDGTYKTSDGKTLIVQGGIIAAQSGSSAAPTDSKPKAGIVGPMFNPAAAPSGSPVAPNKLMDRSDAAGPTINLPPRIPERITRDLKRPPGAPGRHLPPLSGGCPDPAVTELRVGWPGRNPDGTYVFRLVAIITNLGRAPFISRSNQQMISFYEGGSLLHSEPWTTSRLASGEGVSSFVPPLRWNPSSEFLADFSAQITYDPDIFIDGNPQNDDCVMSNNKLLLTVDEVRRQLPDGGR